MNRMHRATSTLGFGIALPSSGRFATAPNIFSIAERAQACGFDDVWVNDHYSYPRARLTRSSAGSIEAVADQDPNFFESLTTLAAIGGRLSRIGLAVHGLILPIRDPRLFWIHSRWIDEAAFETHAELPHTVRFVERVQQLIDHPLDVTRAHAIT